MMSKYFKGIGQEHTTMIIKFDPNIFVVNNKATIGKTLKVKVFEFFGLEAPLSGRS